MTTDTKNYKEKWEDNGGDFDYTYQHEITCPYCGYDNKTDNGLICECVNCGFEILDVDNIGEDDDER